MITTCGPSGCCSANCEVTFNIVTRLTLISSMNRLITQELNYSLNLLFVLFLLIYIMPAHTKYSTFTTDMWTADCNVNTVYIWINLYATVNNRQQRDAGSGLQQATRRLSGRGRVLEGVGGCRHKKGGILQATSQLRRSSYHIYLAFIGQSWQLDVRGGCLDSFIRGQETSSVDQAGGETGGRKIKVITCSPPSPHLDISCTFSEGCKLTIVQTDSKGV